MDNALAMDCRQRPQHRDHHVQGFLRADFPALTRDVGFKGNALDVVHNEVGSAVLIEIVRHPGDIWLTHEFGQGPGFLLKPLPAIGKFVLLALHGHGDGVCLAGANIVWHVLLHRHPGL